ncbi:MAG: hypothetical protein ABSF61_10765 [Anaerolineales bacterium]|jgi:hypothetical protein
MNDLSSKKSAIARWPKTWGRLWKAVQDSRGEPKKVHEQKMQSWMGGMLLIAQCARYLDLCAQGMPSWLAKSLIAPWDRDVEQSIQFLDESERKLEVGG